MDNLKLGLIGDNIAASQAPRLHRLAGELVGLRVTYDRLVPQELGRTFDEVFDACGAEGYDGINVTYPYKELAAAKVAIDESLVRQMGAVNTVLFASGGPRGYNTDYSGFIAAYEAARPGKSPGAVTLIGAGGVGKAVAFGLLTLGGRDIRIVDRDPSQSVRLAHALSAAEPECSVTVHTDLRAAVNHANGLLNCTPTGMVGYDGTPLAQELMWGADWVFDAVYTPTDTRFLADAAQTGLAIINGYELFFHQGVRAFERFSGKPLDADTLRARLGESSR